MNFDKSHTSVLNQSVDEKLFSLLVTSVKDYAIFMIDPNGHILSWNQGAENIKGYKEKEVIGKHISIFYTATDREKNEPRQNLNSALKHGSFKKEGWCVRKDGSVFWAHAVFTTLYNESGHLAGFAKVIHDITEQKFKNDQKEEVKAGLEKLVNENTKRIAANEIKFRKLIEQSYDGITLFDENLQITYRSISAGRINGWSNSARNEFELSDMVHPDDKNLVVQLFADVLSHPDAPIVATFRTRHKDGHYIWIESLFTNRLGDENINAIVCNFRDITDRKIADEEISKKTEQIENILESITDGFIALDNDLCYTYANKKVGEMVGCKPADLIGKKVWDVFPEAIGSDTYHAFNRAIETQQYVCQEDYFEPLKLWQENHIYPSSAGLSVFIRNITEKKNADMERERITADLVKRNKDLEQFTYIISHNLRAPVANIKGLSDLLSSVTYEDQDSVQTLDALSLSVSNLDRVIIDLNQILQTGKHGNDKNEWVSLPQLVGEITSQLEPLMTANNVVINSDFSAVGELYTLKSYLYSIFQNLIVNSIKYHQIDVTPVIDITTSLKRGKACISFNDNGKGIDLARHGAQVFGLYKRFDYTVEGKGMGLFMVKMQVESLGGNITVKSELGVGTEFMVELFAQKK